MFCGVSKVAGGEEERNAGVCEATPGRPSRKCMEVVCVCACVRVPVCVCVFVCSYVCAVGMGWDRKERRMFSN